MRTTVWTLGDQLLEQHPALMAAEAKTGQDRLHVVLVESRLRPARLTCYIGISSSSTNRDYAVACRMGPNVLSLGRIGIEDRLAIQQQAGEFSDPFARRS